MSKDLMAEVPIAVKGCSVLVLSKRSLFKYLTTAACGMLFAVIFMTQPISVQARDMPDMNSSSEEVMTTMKGRLNLTKEQETKIQPIIEENIRKRLEILKKGSQDRSTIKSELQELQWKTDMQLGAILTEEQMKEYEKFREEQSERIQRSDMQGSRGPRSGGLRSGRSLGF